MTGHPTNPLPEPCPPEEQVKAVAALIHNYTCCLHLNVHGDHITAQLTSPDACPPNPDHTTADKFRAHYLLQALTRDHGYTLTKDPT